DHVEERGLPGAVGPDEREHLPFVDPQIDLVQRAQPTEDLRDPVGFEDGRHRASARTSYNVCSWSSPPVSSRARRLLGMSPCGRNIMTRIRMRPNTRDRDAPNGPRSRSGRNTMIPAPTIGPAHPPTPPPPTPA